MVLGMPFFVSLMPSKPPSATSPQEAHSLVQQVVRCSAFTSSRELAAVCGEDGVGMRQGWELWLLGDGANDFLISLVSIPLACRMTVWRSLAGLDLRLGSS